MPSTKYVELSYPTHFLKSRGIVIRNIYFNIELIKPHILRDEMILCIASNKLSKTLDSLFSLSFSDTIYS